MSWDLLVATYSRPAPENLSAPTPLVSLFGPHAVEIEDLPDALSAHVLWPRFLMEISVPAAGGRTDVKAAVTYAKRIADQYGGAVYDPQDDKVLWPKRRARYRRPQGEERIRVITLAWYFALTRDPHELGNGLVSLMRRLCREALPVRYGGFEPLQRRVQPADEREMASVIANGPIWTSTSPCFGGSAWCGVDSQRRAAQGSSPANEPVRSIQMDFDGRPLHQDARWRETTVRLFLDAARQLGAFYAGAFVANNLIGKGSRFWYGPGSEHVRLPHSVWDGIPEAPAWLAWFGAPYQSIADEALGPRGSRYPDGIFFRAGEEPMDRRELMAAVPRFPAELAQPCAQIPTLG